VNRALSTTQAPFFASPPSSGQFYTIA